MGYFYDQKGRAAGEFYHRETKARFEFRSTIDSWRLSIALIGKSLCPMARCGLRGFCERWPLSPSM